MPTLDELASFESIKEEYQKAFLLNVFQKLCVRMDRNLDYKRRIHTLYRESFNSTQTTILIVKNEFCLELSEDQGRMITQWIKAYFCKKPNRKAIPLSVKIELFKKQSGKCMVCGELLGEDWSKIHVDHIIPWKLVGDELPENYQDLCDTCNKCKSARTDYIFRKMIHLN